MSFENLKKHKERKKEMYRWASSEERKHFKTLKSKTLLFRFTLVFISSPSVHSAHSLSQQSVRFHFLTSTWFVVAAVDISHPPDHHTSLNSLFFVHISHCPRRKREPTFFSKKKKIWTRENRHRHSHHHNNYSHRMHHHHHNHNQT